MSQARRQTPADRPFGLFAIAAAVVVCLVLAGLWRLRRQVRSQERATPERIQAGESHGARKTRISSLSSQPASLPGEAPTSRSAAAATRRDSKPAMGPMLERGPSGMTRTYRHDFRGANAPPEFFAKTDNVEAGVEGFRLKKTPEGKYPAQGVVESQPIPTEIPINAVGVHWAQELPEQTSMKVESSTSSDGVSWTTWEQVMLDDDSNEQEPFFPDGRPNPNFGDKIGALQFRSDNQGTFVRYRVTLGSDNPEATPVLGRVALTYMDSSDPGTNMRPENEPLKSQ